jgi:hypothetical protein
MSQRLSDRFAEVVDPIVVEYGPEFSWDYSIQLLPGPQGAVALGVFVMVMKNPLLGTGDMAAIEMVQDITSMSDPEFVKKIVAQTILQLRELRAKNLEIPTRA